MTNDPLREYQEAFLLLQLLQRDPDRRKKSVLNDLAKANRTLFGTKAAVPNGVRADLLAAGYVSETKKRGAFIYEITDRGKSRLAELQQYPERLNRVTGEMVNELLAYLREFGGQFESPTVSTTVDTTPPAPATAPAPEPVIATKVATTAEIREEILRALPQLHRNEYAGRSLVPIFAIRQRVGDALGPDAATHDQFDPVMKALRSEGQLRLVAGTDPTLPQEQREAAIPGIGETLFYAELTS